LEVGSPEEIDLKNIFKGFENKGLIYLILVAGEELLKYIYKFG
jgi:hypothetical protein